MVEHRAVESRDNSRSPTKVEEEASEVFGGRIVEGKICWLKRAIGEQLIEERKSSSPAEVEEKRLRLTKQRLTQNMLSKKK